MQRRYTQQVEETLQPCSDRVHPQRIQSAEAQDEESTFRTILRKTGREYTQGQCITGTTQVSVCVCVCEHVCCVIRWVCVCVCEHVCCVIGWVCV